MVSKESKSSVCPTLESDALHCVFNSTMNIRSTNNTNISAWFAKVPSGENGVAWITRTAQIDTHYHRASEVLELAQEAQIDFVDGKAVEIQTEGEGYNGAYFWPIISNEFMGRAFCGEIGAARKLMRAIEQLWATDALLIGQLIEACENPLQVYLFEFEPEGYGVVHVSYNYEWDGAFEDMESALRKRAPEIFEKLPYIFNSDDFFGTYDFYCSQNFIEQTSEELAIAAWTHCIDQEELRNCLTNGGAESNSHIEAWVAQAEGRIIEGAMKPSYVAKPTPRV